MKIGIIDGCLQQGVNCRRRGCSIVGEPNQSEYKFRALLTVTAQVTNRDRRLIDMQPEIELLRDERVSLKTNCTHYAVALAALALRRRSSS